MLHFKFAYLFAISLLVSILNCHPTHAMGVQFDLLEQIQVTPSSSNTNDEALQLNHIKPAAQASEATFTPLAIPPAAIAPPINTGKYGSKRPNNVVANTRVLPPPPIEALPTSRILPPKSPIAPPTKTLGLSFTPEQSVHSPAQATSPSTPPSKHHMLPDWIYEGGSDSLVARVIGSAEGTRTPSGKPTRAYYGHTDPGNGVWNMGTFSYQHGARSPQEADKKQLKRLRKQGKTLENQAHQAQLAMTLSEMLNGLDLANQSPRAALGRGGYVERLVQAKEQGMDNSHAIVWARTYAYLDPDTQRWNAPGLGNTLHGIQRDQNRRHESIAHAFSHYQAHQPIEQPPGERLPFPTVASSQQPRTTISASNRPLTLQNRSKPEQTPAKPITFEVAAAIQPTEQTMHSPKEPISPAPKLEPQASPINPIKTTSSPIKDQAQTYTNPEDAPRQING